MYICKCFHTPVPRYMVAVCLFVCLSVCRFACLSACVSGQPVSVCNTHAHTHTHTHATYPLTPYAPAKPHTRAYADTYAHTHARWQTQTYITIPTADIDSLTHTHTHTQNCKCQAITPPRRLHRVALGKHAPGVPARIVAPSFVERMHAAFDDVTGDMVDAERLIIEIMLEAT